MKKPDFSFERQVWKKGFRVIAGVDEVGRGAWAGPIVASAVAFAPQIKNLKFKIENLGVRVDDSKKLSPSQREKADLWIKENCLAFGIGEASSSVINRLGMARATKMAFRRAIAECNRRLDNRWSNVDLEARSSKLDNPSSNFQLQNLASSFNRRPPIDFLLIDAFYIPFVRGLRRKHQKPIINGDQKSFSIAAASIIAKVYRDSLMTKLSRKYTNYSWGSSKGYGTKEHQKAILRYGLTRFHRKKFVESWRGKVAKLSGTER